MSRRLPIEDTIERMYSLMEQRSADNEMEDAFHKLCDEFNGIAEINDDAYTIYVQFVAMACIVRAHIYAKKPDAIQYEMQMLGAFHQCALEDIFTEAQFMKILELLNQIVRECNDYIKSEGYDIDVPDIIQNFGKIEHTYTDIQHEAEVPHACYLCKLRAGNFKGSHLAPNFLIQPFLSVDGTTNRDKGLISEIMLGQGKKARQWGRGVEQQAIEEQFGEIPESELTAVKTNAVTRDNYFCHQCEDRFGFYESLYADYFCKRKNSVHPVHSYLFWLGVFWRLSIANMCIKMSPEDEDNACKILDKAMPYTLKGARKMTATEELGEFCYTIVHCSDTKGERNALLGSHVQKSPYKLVIGEYIVTLYVNKNQATGKYPVNDYTKEEEMAEVPFLEFWKLKQDIMDETQDYEYANACEEGHTVTDIAFGGENDTLEKMFHPGGKAPDLSEVNLDKKYGFIIPGALTKVLSYHKEHPFDSPEELWHGIKETYGYTKEDMDSIVKYVLDKPKIKLLLSEKEIQCHKRRKQSAKEKQRANLRKHRKKKGK